MGQISDYLSHELPRTPKVDDKYEVGIGNFKAFVRVRESYVKTNSATSIPLEDGSIISDHININPLKISIEGEVANVHIRRESLAGIYTRANAEISSVTKYGPQRTRSQISKANALILQGADIVRKLEDVAGGISNIYEIFGNKDSAKDQQNQFLDQIEKLMDSKQVIRLDMPYRVCENMVITEVQIVRDNTTDQAVSFKLSAQQILIAKTIYTDISALKKNPASGLNGKTDDVKDKGLNKVKDVSTSLATRIKEAAFGQ